MKQILRMTGLIRPLLLMLALLLFGNVRGWAETVTYKLTIDTDDFNTTSYAANNIEKTTDAICTTDATKTFEVKWTSNQIMENSSAMQWQKNTGCLYNTTDLGTITAVNVTSSAGTFTTYYGTSAKPSSSTTVGGGFFQVKVGNATGKSTKVEITFTIDEGNPNLTTSDLAITSTTTALSFDLYNNANAQTISYTTSSTGAVIVSGGTGYVTTSVDATNKTITVTPTAVTPSAQTITISQAADETYAAGSATFTVNISDTTPFAGGDITFVAGTDVGQTTSNNSADEVIKSVVTMSCTDAAFATAEYRAYKNSTLTFSTTKGKISKIRFTAESGYSLSSMYQTSGTNGYDTGTGVWTGSEESVSFSLTAQIRFSQIVVTIESEVPDTRTATTVTINANDITNTNVFEGTAAGQLAATVMAGEEAVNGATIVWSGNNDAVATIDGTSGTVTLVGAGTVTFIATYEGDNNYKGSSATYDLTVTNVDPNAPGTQNNPYTVAQAIAATPTSGTSDNVYIKGIVSEFRASDIISDGTNYRYYISDDGTTTNQLLVYKGKGLNDVAFSSADDLLIGDEVVILGGLTTFSNAPEVASNNYIVSLKRKAEAGLSFSKATATATIGETFTAPTLTNTHQLSVAWSSSNTAVATIDASTGAVTLVAAGETTITASFAGNDEYKAGSASYTLTVESHEPSINAENIELAYDETSGEIAYTIDNPVTGNALTATSEVNWISNINVETDKVTFSTTANEDSEERTATITLTYGNASKNVTVTQAAFVADYATLPFSWEGGTSSELTALQGVTANGLGTDYAASNAPYRVKFDTTNDYIQVKTDSQPGVVTIDVKMIGGADASSITVQESADGTAFTNVETLEISGKQNDELTLETTEAFQEASRYVRLSFTRGSNVGVGAISIAKYVEPSTDPAIAVSETNIEAPAAGREGTISVTYQNITEVTSEVYFCDAEGNSTTYDWITADFNSQDYTQLEYLIEPNDNSEARTAYMKVYALDDDANDVYSDVITVTQDGSVKYTLTIEPGQNCTLNVYTDPTSALQSGAKVINGTTIYVNATAAEGFGTPTISVKNGDEDIELTYDSEAGAYYFTLESDVTISATAVEATTYALATGISTIGSGKHYIIVSNVINDYFAMGTQNQNNRAAVSVTANNGTISVSSQDVKEVVIVGPDKDSHYAIYDGTGYLYAASSSDNYLKTKEELDANGLWSISFDDGTHAATITASGDKTRNNLRFNTQSTLFSCYKSGQADVYLYEKVNDTPEATDVVSITSAGYATYCSEHALDFSNATGIKAYVGTLNGTELTFTPITKVPARTGVLLQSTGGTEVGATIIPITTTPSEVTNNCLTGVTAETTLSSEDYILNVKEAGAGFYKAGNYTTLGANRAYIAAQQGGQVKGFVINLNGDLPTGVAQMDGEKLNADDAAIFNLSGQRISKPQKGVNIVNGKKVLVK